MRILHGECYCPTVDTVYAPWRSENFRITCDDDKYHKWQSHFHSSLLIEKSSKFITSTTKVDRKQLYYTMYVHTIPYTTEVYGLSISAILYGRWTYQLRSYKFLSLIMPNNKINRKKIPSADALLISNEQWWNGSCFFFATLSEYNNISYNWTKKHGFHAMTNEFTFSTKTDSLLPVNIFMLWNVFLLCV